MVQEVGINSYPEPSQFATFAEWLQATLQARSETPHHASVAAGLSESVCGHILKGHPPERNTLARLASYFGVQSTESLFALAGHRPQEEVAADLLVRALDEKRTRGGLQHQDVIDALGITKAAYWRRYRGQTRLRFQTLGGVVRFLEETSAEQVLEWEGYTARLSPPGKLIAPRMLELGLSQKALAKQASLDEETLEGVLYGTKYPEPETLKRLAKELHITWADMRRERQRLPTPSAPPYIQRLFRRRGRRKGQDLLQHIGRALGNGYRDGQWKNGRTITPDDRRERSQVANQALKERWATATPEERRRFGLAHLQAKLKGQFGLCRVCGKLTYLPRAVMEKGARAEYHGPCLAKWRTKSKEFATWSAEKSKPGNEAAGPCPYPPYPVNRHASPKDLAGYYEAAVEYLRIKKRTWESGPRPREQPETIADLARNLNLTERGLEKQVERLLKLLPDPVVCNQAVVRMAAALKELAS